MANWYLRTQDETFGPETEEQLVAWARLGRIQPGQEVSDDNEVWQRVEDVPFLDMRFSIDIGDGNPRGPFNKAAAEALLASGRLPRTATIVETREPFAPKEEPPAAPPAEAVGTPAGNIVEKIVEVPVERIVEKVIEVPVEKIVEKVVEVPVEKIVEKVVEREVPVQVIKEVVKEVPVEVEKIVVDETRIHQLEAEIAEWQGRHAEQEKVIAEKEGLVQAREAEKKDLLERADKLQEQVTHLEDELRRLPQAASEVADIQAAMYGIMKRETEELDALIEAEKRELEDFKTRQQERIDRLMERRREVLKRSGVNIEDMTRKALLERPEDPRTAQLRKDLEALRRQRDEERVDFEGKIHLLAEQLRQGKAADARAAEGLRDATQLRQEVQRLKEQLTLRENELMSERQRIEELRQNQATRQQVLMARLATLESPSIGTSSTLSTNQSREAHQVKLPSWMRLGK